MSTKPPAKEKSPDNVPPTAALSSRCLNFIGGWSLHAAHRPLRAAVGGTKALRTFFIALTLLVFTNTTLAQQPAPTTAATPHSYRPFLDPVDIRDSWFLLLIPMAFLISLAYKAVRCHDMRRYWRAVMAMTLQVIFGMIALGAGFYVLIEYVLPRVAP